MAKSITRKTLNLWGGSGASSSFAQFGSQTAGAPIKTKDIATIQALAAWNDGWQDAVALGQAPYMEDMNALMYVFAYQQFYYLQEGVAEWDAGTTYFIGSLVKRTGTSEIYSSLTDTNLNNALPTAGASNTNWQFVSGIISSSFRIGGPLAMNSQKVTGAAAGATTGDLATYEQVLLLAGGQMAGDLDMNANKIKNSSLTKYRRPNLLYSSGTVVSVETGIVTGTSGNATILFPDGDLRTETSSTRYQATISQNAVFSNATLGSNLGGLRSGSAVNNTWYAAYAVKVTTFAANWVMVLDTVLPIQANYATLNSNFGANSWVYLGLVRYGDGAGTANAILRFQQAGGVTLFYNPGATGSVASGVAWTGILFANTASATTLSYSYATGTAGATIPNNISLGLWSVGGTVATIYHDGNAAGTGDVLFGGFSGSGVSGWISSWTPVAVDRRARGTGGAGGLSIIFSGFVDSVLGGANALL